MKYTVQTTYPGQTIGQQQIEAGDVTVEKGHLMFWKGGPTVRPKDDQIVAAFAPGNWASCRPTEEPAT